jgi:hypothetical protein
VSIQAFVEGLLRLTNILEATNGTLKDVNNICTLAIFSFTVFIVNEYFITVTKLRICAHHLLLTIILSILKCVTLYQVTIILSYLYKSFPILTLKITPQTVLFNDEDFHSVEILETVVRQSGVLAHRKKCLLFYYCHKVKDLCSPPFINDYP